MEVILSKDLWLDNTAGVVSAGSRVEVEEQRGRELLRMAYAKAAPTQTASKPAKPKNKAPENKALGGAPQNKQASAAECSQTHTNTADAQAAEPATAAELADDSNAATSLNA